MRQTSTMTWHIGEALQTVSFRKPRCNRVGVTAKCEKFVIRYEFRIKNHSKTAQFWSWNEKGKGDKVKEVVLRNG